MNRERLGRRHFIKDMARSAAVMSALPHGVLGGTNEVFGV